MTLGGDAPQRRGAPPLRPSPQATLREAGETACRGMPTLVARMRIDTRHKTNYTYISAEIFLAFHLFYHFITRCKTTRQKPAL